MNPNKVLQEKRQFIYWFLETQTLKNPQSIKVLYTLLQNDTLLIQTKFVTDISGFQNALLISAESTPAQPFICKVGGIYYHLIEESVAALSSLSSETLYVCLSYKRCFPCTSTDLIMDPQHNSDEDFMETVAQEMQQYLWQKEIKKHQLLIAIDEALDQKNKEEFTRLTKKLNSL